MEYKVGIESMFVEQCRVDPGLKHVSTDFLLFYFVGLNF